jgi:hypothetical protein
MTRILKSGVSVVALAERLNSLPEVRRFDDEAEREADRLAHSLSDIESSISEILERYLPKLVEGCSADDLNAVLLDIGDELKHVLYHARDPKYFRSLVGE